MAVTPPVPASPAAPSKFKKVLNGIVAALTSSAAVKEEKSLAAIVVTGILVDIGASTGLVSLVENIINSL